MTRVLYSGLVRLHPPRFRAEFGDEMLWIFDESPRGGSWGLFADAFVSILRQWIIGRGTWKIAAAFVGGVIHLWLVFALLMLRPPFFKTAPDDPIIFHASDPVNLSYKEKPACSNCATSANYTPESPQSAASASLPAPERSLATSGRTAPANPPR